MEGWKSWIKPVAVSLGIAGVLMLAAAEVRADMIVVTQSPASAEDVRDFVQPTPCADAPVKLDVKALREALRESWESAREELLRCTLEMAMTSILGRWGTPPAPPPP